MDKNFDELKQQQDTELAEQQGISKVRIRRNATSVTRSKGMLGNFYKGQKENGQIANIQKKILQNIFPRKI